MKEMLTDVVRPLHKTEWSTSFHSVSCFGLILKRVKEINSYMLLYFRSLSAFSFYQRVKDTSFEISHFTVKEGLFDSHE